MKKRIIAASIALTATGSILANDIVGHTFLSVRPLDQTAMPLKISHFRDRPLARENGLGGAFQIIAFGGQSTNASDLGQYFGPVKRTMGPENSFVVKDAADTVPYPGDPDNLAMNYTDRDINAAHFNIRTEGDNFNSTITFNPRQTYGGIGFNYIQYFDNKESCPRHWWFEINLPLVHLKNDMQLEETPLPQPTPVVFENNSNKSMTQAFLGLNGVGGENGTAGGTKWNYGRIAGPLSSTQIADMEFKLGYTSINDECCYLHGYLGVQIPTANRPTGEYVFEPIAGHNGHWGFMTGAAYASEVWSNCDKALWFEFENNSRYFFKREESRSFDLIGKPWSRYMEVYADQNAATGNIRTPGINAFTREFDVSPRFQHNFTSAFVYTSNCCRFQAEAGYNFWARQAETLELTDAFVGVALPDSANPNLVNNARTIAVNYTSAKPQTTDPAVARVWVVQPYEDSGSNATVLTENDIDYNSVAAPAALTHTVYASVGYRWDTVQYPTFIGLGGSFEFSDINTAVNRWMLWGKFGLSI